MRRQGTSCSYEAEAKKRRGASQSGARLPQGLLPLRSLRFGDAIGLSPFSPSRRKRGRGGQKSSICEELVLENLTSRKLTWANKKPRWAVLPRRPFQTHISTISVHDAEFSAKKGGPVASRPAKRRYHERHFAIGNAPAKNFARRTMRTEGRKACEESVFRWQGNWNARPH